MRQAKDINPWDWLNDHDTARFGSILHEPAERARMCNAILTGGLPLLWREYAKPVRELVFAKMQLKRGDRVLLIGESLESCLFTDEIRQSIGAEGEINAIELIEDARTAVMGLQRGRGGQLGTWPYRYTQTDPEGHYDVIAVLQGVQHTDDWHETAVEFVRVLKPGGMIVLGEITFGPNFTNAMKMDVHLEYYIQKLCQGAGMSGVELAYYSPDELYAAFEGLVENPGSFEWRGVECFWGRKPA